MSANTFNLATLEAKCVVPSANTLGEGVIWNQLRACVMWFDIIEKTLMTYEPDSNTHQTYNLPVMGSAAMLTEHPDIILISTERGIEHFNFQTQTLSLIKTIEADKPLNRSNDGKGAPDGSFWVSTMAKNGTDPTGALYRISLAPSAPKELSPTALAEYIHIEPCLSPLTIPNSLCFTHTHGFYTDTPTQKIMQFPHPPTSPNLSATATLWVDSESLPGYPDGSTVDATGNLWNARWGSGTVQIFSPTGAPLDQLKLPVSQGTCPAFGGKTMDTLYITTARENLSETALAQEPLAGGLFACSLAGTPHRGVPEPVFGRNTENFT